jgi:hypothetical protein
MAGPEDKTPDELRNAFLHSTTPIVRIQRVEKLEQLPLLEETINNWSEQPAQRSTGGRFNIQLLRERLAFAKVAK